MTSPRGRSGNRSISRLVTDASHSHDSGRQRGGGFGTQRRSRLIICPAIPGHPWSRESSVGRDVVTTMALIRLAGYTGTERLMEVVTQAKLRVSPARRIPKMYPSVIDRLSLCSVKSLLRNASRIRPPGSESSCSGSSDRGPNHRRGSMSRQN